MKKKSWALVLTILVYAYSPVSHSMMGSKKPSSKPAVPINIENMRNILDQIPGDLSDSICGFDIDGTLIEPSAADFKKRVPVESDTPHIVQELADRGCTVIAITARIPGKRTPEELSEAGFSFFLRHEFARPFGFVSQILFSSESGNVQYQDGILFASNTDKGAVLSALIKSHTANPSKKVPKNVVFVDDAISEARNVKRAMTDDGIRNFVFRYLAPDREHFDY